MRISPPPAKISPRKVAIVRETVKKQQKEIITAEELEIDGYDIVRAEAVLNRERNAVDFFESTAVYCLSNEKVDRERWMLFGSDCCWRLQSASR